VYQTFLRSLYAGVSNLCVIGGNAREVLPKYFPKESMDHIFVNHPEPPQQTGNKDDSEAQHLLNEVLCLLMLFLLLDVNVLVIVVVFP